MGKPILYSYFRSSCSWRVRIIALNLKGIDYEYSDVHLAKDGGMQKKEEYTSVNPMQQVPSLLIDGETLTQSLPIMEYLEEKFPTPSLFPNDAIGRAKVRALAEVVNSGIQPFQSRSVLRKVGDEKAHKEWANFWINKGFVALEEMLKKTAGKYCYGDKVTLADVCLIPQIFGAQRFNVDMSQFPVISKISEELEKLDAIEAAHPTKQPDCPEELRGQKFMEYFCK